MWNFYGLIEVIVYGSMWKVQKGEDVIIGSFILNGYFYVFDENLNLVLFGQFGEFYIGGVGVVKGYCNNVELSRICFFLNFFYGGLMYKIGDVVCYVGFM